MGLKMKFSFYNTPLRHNAITPVIYELKHSLRLCGLSQFEIIQYPGLILILEGLVNFLNRIGA